MDKVKAASSTATATAAPVAPPAPSAPSAPSAPPLAVPTQSVSVDEIKVGVMLFKAGDFQQAVAKYSDAISAVPLNITAPLLGNCSGSAASRDFSAAVQDCMNGLPIESEGGSTRPCHQIALPSRHCLAQGCVKLKPE